MSATKRNNPPSRMIEILSQVASISLKIWLDSKIVSLFFFPFNVFNKDILHNWVQATCWLVKYMTAGSCMNAVIIPSFRFIPNDIRFKLPEGTNSNFFINICYVMSFIPRNSAIICINSVPFIDSGNAISPGKYPRFF